MKKRWIKKGTSLFLCGILSMTLMVGCGSKSTETPIVAENLDQVAEDTTSIFGQLTAIDGNSLTIALFETGDMQRGEVPAMPSGKTEDGEVPAMPSDSEKGEMRDGEAPSEMPSGGFGNFTLNGEELTVTVDNTTSYIINGSAGTISDLALDDIITVEMDVDTVVTINVGISGGPTKGAGFSDIPSTETN